MQVFISSTCYDLIDLRAELEVFFRDAGVEACLSDSPTSDFRVMPEDRNSIETCLANVRACDEFIIILSRRYGPSLSKAGFDDVSATHLEYHEAVKGNKPIRMYVREELEGEYGIWRANSEDKNLKLTWCKDPHDRRLFELLKEHRDLVKGKPQNNWFWLFSDSVALKRRLAIDFKPALDRVKINKLSESGRIPFIEVSGRFLACEADRRFHFELLLRNLGTAPALSPILELEDSSNQTTLSAMLGQQEKRIRKWWYLAPWSNNLNLLLRLSYSILEGHQFINEGNLMVHFNPERPTEASVTYKSKERRYLGLAPGMNLL